jgi:hypothetical protein
MQTNRRAGLAALVLAAFCAFVPGLASAQGTQNPYAVAGVYVDETAANAAAAQQAGGSRCPRNWRSGVCRWRRDRRSISWC